MAFSVASPCPCPSISSSLAALGLVWETGLTGLFFCGVLVVALNPVRAEQLRLELYPGNGITLTRARGIHAARVDMPSLIDMSHASPDRWSTLPPPVDLFERLRAPAPPLEEYDIPPPTVRHDLCSSKLNAFTPDRLKVLSHSGHFIYSPHSRPG